MKVEIGDNEKKKKGEYMKTITYPGEELQVIIRLLMDLDTSNEEVRNLLKQINDFDINLQNYLTKYGRIKTIEILGK